MYPRRRLVRLIGALLVLCCVATLVFGYSAGADAAGDGRLETGQKVAPEHEGVTVVSTDSNTWLGQGEDGPRAKAELFAVGPSGRVIYYNDSHTRYWDVDPVPGTSRTVEYVAADHLGPSACGGEEPCTRNVVERVNLSTGETTRVFARVTGGKHSTRWHDADRIDETHVAVADIAKDRVFVVNTTTGTTTWAWSAQQAFDPATSGGPFPEDWTHINDVEVLDDGRLMVSLRNHDQVVVLDPETGLQEELTLGADGDHETLYEQHNPDYIPERAGGPAVLVADSENDRLVEYQRRDGEWEQSWTWSDDRLQWVRDGDRLPNGHTLVTDSNGNRVLELDDSGEVVWSLDVAFPYEAERLGTGDESTGGPSAVRAGLSSQSAADDSSDSAADAGPGSPLAGLGSGLLDGKLVNSVFYVLPVWVGGVELLAGVVLAGTLVAWAGAELYLSRWQVSVTWPFSLDSK